MEFQLLSAPEKYSPISVPKKSTTAHERWEVGKVIDEKYEIQDILAQDNNKVIYKVRHCQWNISLAVRSQLDKESQVSFFHQAERWVELDKHPNVVSAYYVQNIGGIPRLFVEYVKAKTLEQFMEATTCGIETIIDIGLQICWGMEHAHHKGLLHGDLNPANIFITEELEVKITDFRSRESTTEYSPYMPPEQFEKNLPVQAAIDIYAFGAMMYQLCIHEMPFKIDYDLDDEEAREHFKNMLLTQPPRLPHQVDPQIPRSLSDLIMKCLIVTPESRPRHFEDIIEDLQQIYLQVTRFRYPRTPPNQETLRAVDLNNRALSLLDLGQEEEAAEHLEEAVIVNRNCTGAVINLYLLQLREGTTTLTQLRTATKSLLESDLEVATFYRSKIALERGSCIEEALQEVEAALQKFVDNKELLRVKGLLLKRLSQHEAAIAIFSELVDTEMPSLQDVYSLSSCYLEIGKKKKVRELLQVSMKNYQREPYLTLAMGVTMALQGKVKEAHSYFSQIIAETPDRFWALLHSAEITAAFGHYIKAYNKATPALDKAQDLYEKLLKRAPRLPRVVRSYQILFDAQLPEFTKPKDEIYPFWSYVRSLGGHQEGVHCMALSPDGRIVVAGGADKYLRIWDISSGRCKNTLTAHLEGTSQISISHDGHFAVSIGRDNVAMVWDLIAGECVSRLEGHMRDVTAIDLTHTGYLITGSIDNTLRIWDLGALSCRSILKGHDDKINCLATTPDGKIAISGGEDEKIGIWDIEIGNLVTFLSGHTEGVTCLAVTPNGRWLASGSWDQKIKIYEIESGECIATLEGHTGTLNCLAITSDSELVISGSEDKTIRVWKIPNGECLYTLTGHTVDVTCLAIAPYSRFLVSGSWDQTLRIWDLNLGECMAVLEGHTDLVNAVAISPDERFILSGGDDPILRVWSDLTTELCRPFEEPPLSYLLQRPPMDDGNIEGLRKVEKLLTQAEEQVKEQKIVEAMAIFRQMQNVEGFAHHSRVLNSIYETAQQANLQRKKPREVWQHHVLKGHTNAITCMAISRDGHLIVSGSRDHTMKIWDIEEGVCLATLSGHTAPIACVKISPNGRFIISGSYDNTLRLWELETGRCIYSMSGHQHWVEHAQFTPDGRRIISASRDTNIRIWERKTGHRLYSLTSHTDLISALQITSDGKQIISGSHDRTIRVWELETGQCLHSLEKHSEHIKCICSVDNDKLLLSGGWDTVLYLWDLEQGECIRSFEGHQNWVNDICVTKDGKKAISCGLDKTIRVWDIESGNCLQTFIEHTQDVNHITVTDDARFCISSSWDKSIRIWDLESSECCCSLIVDGDAITTLHALQNHRYVITGSKDGQLTVWAFDWDWEYKDV